MILPELHTVDNTPLEHLCVELIQSLDGSGDDKDDVYCREIIVRLRRRLADWRPSCDQREAYDEAARQRVIAAIELAEGLMISRRVWRGV
jgi:hypothetical protein